MKTQTLIALTAAILVPVFATLGQTAATAPGQAPTPTAPSPGVTGPVIIPSGSPSTTGTTVPATTPNATATGPSGPGDVLSHPSDAPVVAHGTGPELVIPATVLTNDSSDEILDTVAFDAIPLPDAVNALALQAGLNIIFDPKLQTVMGPDGHPVPVTPPNITQKWKHVTAKQALSSLLDNWGWQLAFDPHTPIGRVTTKDPAALEPLVTTVIQLEYANPTNVLAEVKETLSTRSSIVSDLRTHKLIVRTTERELPAVKELITKLDSSERQVLIEAKIIETTKDITSAKGVDWTGTLAAQHVSFGNGLTSGALTNGLSQVTTPLTSGTTTLPGGSTVSSITGGGLTSTVNNNSSYVTTIPGTPAAGGGLSLNTAHGFSPSTAFLNADGVSAVISFLNTDADTKSISFPRTVALDGVQTVLMAVQNIPIFEQNQSAPAAGASQGLATVLPNYDKEVRGTILNEVGVKLTVVPRIAGPTNILMDLRPEISSPAGTATATLNGEVSTSPIFQRRSIITQAAVPSGYTLVLGGLESDNDNKTYTKVPFLGDLPGIGYLFRSDSKSRHRDTILIFVTPTIIRDSDFQYGDSTFLQRKGITPSNAEDPYWDTGKPYDWTKPKPGVTPAYQP